MCGHWEGGGGAQWEGHLPFWKMSSCLHQLHIFHLLYVLKYVLNTPTLCARTALLKNPSKKDKKIANGLCGLDLQYRRGFTTDAVQVADDCSRNSKSAAFECRKVECIMRYRKKRTQSYVAFSNSGLCNNFKGLRLIPVMLVGLV